MDILEIFTRNTNVFTVLAIVHAIILIVALVDNIRLKIRRGTDAGDLIVTSLVWLCKAVLGLVVTYLIALACAYYIPFNLSTMAYGLILTVIEIMFYVSER